ncbi:MAG TPA: hypothetical protein VEB42_02440, partial [Chitinophagaceae bacterium]|nr:hypothetical protein [Chitinophagaceae bacterium]
MASKFSAKIPVGDFTPQQFLVLVSNAFSKLGWEQLGMNENSIAASVGMSAASWGEEIMVAVTGQEAEILSKCSQAIDWGKNKRNVNKLINAIEELRNQYTTEQLDEQHNTMMAE